MSDRGVENRPGFFIFILVFMKYLAYGCALLVGLALISCEKEKSGTTDITLSAPFISSTSLTTSSINLDTTSTGAVIRQPNGTYTITDSLAAVVTDPLGTSDLQLIIYHIYSPGSSSPFASGTMARVSVSESTATFLKRFSFTIPRSDIGEYKVEVLARSQADLESNSLVASIVITRNNSIPQLFGLLAPDTLVRPNTGYRIVRFAVTARDSDGLNDITNVFFKADSSSSPDINFPMYDDGNIAFDGDSVANDGRFAVIIPIYPNALIGNKGFRFWAQDRSGALSNPLSHFIEIIPE